MLIVQTELIIVSPRTCPNCGGTAGIENYDYDCSECGFEFCGNCFRINLYDGFDYVFCPAPTCKTKLFLPPLHINTT